MEPAIEIFLYATWHSALVAVLDGLQLEGWAVDLVGEQVAVAICVESPLKSVPFHLLRRDTYVSHMTLNDRATGETEEWKGDERRD